MNKEKLKEIVTKFHDAIIKNKDFEFEYYHTKNKDFHNFPNGCCDIASKLIKEYLNDEYNLNFFIVGSDKYHTFIENKDYIIDITAYQFNEDKHNEFVEGNIFDKIIVEDNKNDYYFYKYKNTEEYIETIYSEYVEFYKKILETIEKDQN